VLQVKKALKPEDENGSSFIVDDVLTKVDHC
jgi:hypothetical protein